MRCPSASISSLFYLNCGKCINFQLEYEKLVTSVLVLEKDKNIQE